VNESASTFLSKGDPCAILITLYVSDLDKIVRSHTVRIVSEHHRPGVHEYSAFKKWFDASMKLAGITDVISVEADVAQFDFLAVAPISFCLLDVDLYLPIAAALPRIYDALSSGGKIVCDDCCPNTMYDGALQAYEEFVENKELAHNVILGKFGIVRKPRN
jgi:hypothetical protein